MLVAGKGLGEDVTNGAAAREGRESERREKRRDLKPEHPEPRPIEPEIFLTFSFFPTTSILHSSNFFFFFES